MTSLPADSAFHRLRNGRESDLETIVGEYAADLFPIAFGILGHSALAESAVVEGLVRALQAPADLVPRGDERRWLLEIVRGQALALRAGTPRRLRKQHEQPTELPAPTGPRPAFLASLSLDEIADAFESLAPLQRRAVSLAYLHGLRTRELAKRMGLDEDHARGHLRSGLLALQDALTPLGEPPV